MAAALNTLEVYGTLSGLRMNSSKCEMIWIGRKNIQLDCKYPFDWNNDNFSLLGLHFHANLDQMAEINYNLAINKVKNTISLPYIWKKRSLTPLGKITVIKTLILSRLNHL